MRALGWTRIVRGTVALAAGLAVPAIALAQLGAPYVGQWRASWAAEQRSYEADVEITPSGGSWRTAVTSRTNPCVGRPVPMKIEASSAEEVRMTLAFADAIPGCPNTFVVLRPGPEGTLTGNRSGRYELKLVRPQ